MTQPRPIGQSHRRLRSAKRLQKISASIQTNAPEYKIISTPPYAKIQVAAKSLDSECALELPRNKLMMRCLATAGWGTCQS